MDLHSLFSASGAFSKHIDHYRPRAQQLEMAEQILSALDRGARLIVEAGTGTGKTLAYLAPLMLHGGKAIWIGRPSASRTAGMSRWKS